MQDFLAHSGGLKMAGVGADQFPGILGTLGEVRFPEFFVNVVKSFRGSESVEITGETKMRPRNDQLIDINRSKVF